MIRLKKDDIYRHYHEDGEIKVHSFLPYLNDVMEVDNDVTFGDFFNHIMRQKGKYSSIFASYLGNFKLQQWEDEWNRIPSADHFSEMDYEMKHVGIRWNGESWNYDGKNEITIDPEFGGVGIDVNGKEIKMSVEFTPINELKSYPFKLDTQLNVYEKAGSSRILLSGKKEFKVYDVVSIVLFEISFSGSPECRNKKINQLKFQVENIKSGKSELIPMEEVFENLKNKIQGR